MPFLRPVQLTQRAAGAGAGVRAGRGMITTIITITTGSGAVSG
jgi:hypothetical protein